MAVVFLVLNINLKRHELDNFHEHETHMEAI